YAGEALPLGRPPPGELDGLPGGDGHGRGRDRSRGRAAGENAGPGGAPAGRAARRGPLAPAPYFRPSRSWRVRWIFWRTLSLAGSSSSDFSHAETADGSSPIFRKASPR